MHCALINGLWTDDTPENAKVILAPWNPSGNHWVLVAIFLPSFTAVYLDPLSNEKNACDAKVMEANIMFSYHVRAKLSNEAKLVWSFPRHTLQEDGYNCGVFVCTYAQRIVKNLSINAEIDGRRERQHIYTKIIGICL